MSKEMFEYGDTVHVYESDGKYLGTGIYQGEIPVRDMLSAENMTEELEGTVFADHETPHIIMVGSDEDIYGVECYFDTTGPNIQ